MIVSTETLGIFGVKLNQEVYVCTGNRSAPYIRNMSRSLMAGFWYFLSVFTLGFVLGIVRILFILPQVGPVIAVFMELPIILLASWSICVIVIRQLAVPVEVNDRLMMGLSAFILLMIGEILVMQLMQGGGLQDFIYAFELPENRIGLGGQIAFALFPVIQLYGSEKPQI